MKFQSIIFRDENSSSFHVWDETFLKDLQINEIVESILKNFKDRGIKNTFYRTLKHSKDINYRLDVFRNLENREILDPLQNLSDAVLKFLDLQREYQNSYEYIREAEIIRVLSQIVTYLGNACNALKNLKYPSEALELFGEYLDTFMKSSRVVSFRKKLEKLKSEISSIKFCLLLQENSIKVFKCKDGENLINFINLVFGLQNDSMVIEKSSIEKSQPSTYIKYEIIRLVAGLFPNEFRDILDFNFEFSDLIPYEIVKFACDFQFYSSYIKMMDNLANAGFKFCIPEISEDNTIFLIKDGYNLNLAIKNLKIGRRKVIPNDIELDSDNRIAAITGPNSSGKTTLVIAVGQIVYFASMGLPVPATYVKIPLFTAIETLFPASENIEDMIGRLEDELRRMRNILKRADENTLVIMNEFLGSTSEKDALNLYEKILPMIAEKNSYGLFVTFVDGIQHLNYIKVYSAVVPEDDPTEKTFIFRQGRLLARNYALEIAKHYRILFEKHSGGAYE